MRNGCGIRCNTGFYDTAGFVAMGPGNTFISHCPGGDMLDFKNDVASPCKLAPTSETGFCAHCRKAMPFGKSTCGGCSKFGAAFAPSYCGAACQRAHWPAHRAECRRAEARLRAMDAAFVAAANAMLVPRLGWGDPLAARCAT